MPGGDFDGSLYTGRMARITGPSADPPPEQLRAALRAVREIVGAAHLLDAGPELDRAARATFATTARAAAIVRPDGREAVQQVVRVANRFGVPLHPISTGKNWGFGSAVPTRDGALLLDLSRLNRILDFDERLGYLTVEPGVTFADAYAHLCAQRSRRFLSSIGGSPRASLIGNAMERGDGSGPYGDRFAHVAALQVVLPTGELVHTGFARFGASPVAPLHRWGVGPALEGLFSQSSLGIVTQMTFWLAPLPQCLELIRFDMQTLEQLAAATEALRELRLEGTLRAPIGIWNDYRVFSTLESYPWHAGGPPLARSVLEQLRPADTPPWSGVTAVYAASERQGRADWERVRSCLEPHVGRVLLEEYTGEAVAGAELGGIDSPALRFFQGVPHVASLRSLYFRKPGRAPADPDPDRDRCGVIWLCPTVPLAAEHVSQAVDGLEPAMLEHGFEPFVAMIAQTDRTLYLIPLIIYDRDEAGADQRALALHDHLFARFCKQGYLPHRLGVQSMEGLPNFIDDSGVLLDRLEAALDPNGVIAPGRYQFRRARQRSRK